MAEHWAPRHSRIFSCFPKDDAGCCHFFPPENEERSVSVHVLGRGFFSSGLLLPNELLKYNFKAQTCFLSAVGRLVWREG